ncbi:MAG: hypothetical protein P4L40_08085 [Terracidiphilus sp.]|nr:hypothetical protein [Terracidiphilus sp.]
MQHLHQIPTGRERKGTPSGVPQPHTPHGCHPERSEGSPYFTFVIVIAIAACFVFSPSRCQAQSKQLRIIILNAKNGHPIKGRTLRIVLGTGANTPDGPTDAQGVILVPADPSTTISLVTQPYAECRPKSPDPWQIKYSVAEILATGLSTPNTCGKGSATARPGEMIIFEHHKGLMNFLAAPIAY